MTTDTADRSSDTSTAPDTGSTPVRTRPGPGRRVTALIASGALAVGLLGGVGIGRVTAPPAAAVSGVGASGLPQGGPGGAGFPGQGGTGAQGLPPSGAAAPGQGGQLGAAPGTGSDADSSTGTDAGQTSDDASTT